MRFPGQVQAAIEVLEEMNERHLPANMALAGWGRAHRFAGSKDRAMIGNLVYDAVRTQSSSRWRMGAETARAQMIGMLLEVWQLSADEVCAVFNGEKFAPPALDEAELERLNNPPETAEEPVLANCPAWLYGNVQELFGLQTLEQCQAFNRRAPLDLRVNTLKAAPHKLENALQMHGVQPGKWLPGALRFPAPEKEGRHYNAEAHGGHGKGWFEVQDEGSQIAALLTGVRPGEQVLDFCAGGGGKTLALAAQMKNTGQIYAYDNDAKRLRPIFERLKRGGVRNVQVLEAGDTDKLADSCLGKMDAVLVDAPCSGSGTWRRRPDAKWRLTPAHLEARMKTQGDILQQAARFVKPGGRLVYVTCSVLLEENEQQIEAFLNEHQAWQIVPYADIWARLLPDTNIPETLSPNPTLLRLTPHTHETDGFFVAILEIKG